MAYIVDIIFVAIFALVVFISAKKGFFMSLFEFIGSLLSFLLAKILASTFTPMVYETFAEPRAEQYLTKALSDVGTTDYSEYIEQALSSIPASLDGAMMLIGIDRESLSQKLSSVDMNGDNLVESIMNTVVEPLGTVLIQLVLFAALAVIILVVMKLAAKLIDKLVDKLPKVKKFNTALGGVFGALRGVVIISVFAVVLSVIAGFISNDAFIESVSNSIIINIVKGLITSFSGLTFET